ncbi:hypothetical protein KCU89_g4226, partial [Aureobasidium melanogenum]
MRSVALALAYLATGIHALPRPAVSYAVVNVDGGSAPTSTEAAQTTVISTVVESEAPTTVSEVVYKTCCFHIGQPSICCFFDVSTGFRNSFNAIIAAIVIAIAIAIIITIPIVNKHNKHNIACIGIAIGYIICRFVLDKYTGVIFRIVYIPHYQEQHSHKRRVLDTQQQQHDNTISVNQLDCIRGDWWGTHHRLRDSHTVWQCPSHNFDNHFGADTDCGSSTSSAHFDILLRQWNVAHVVRCQELPYTGTKCCRTPLEQYFTLILGLEAIVMFDKEDAGNHDMDGG